MRSIVRRDTGESYQAFLTRLAETSGIKTPTREALARLDRKRKKKTSNKDWTNPHDPDAKVTKMKDGRTHLAHKAEHAVDVETGAIVAVTVQGADQGDTTTLGETATAAAEQVEDAQADVDEPQALEEIIGDKGYHSNQSMVDLEGVGIRSYIAEPDRGRRNWSKEPTAQAPVYRNRRRLRGPRGRRLMRQRGERIKRSFAHLYNTGGGHAADASARPPEHSQAGADSRRWLQSRTADSLNPRRWHPPRPPGPTRGRPCGGFRGHRRPAPIHRDPHSRARDRGHARLAHGTDHAPCQLVSGGDLYHGQLAPSP
jgi:hypothetical protein